MKDILVPIPNGDLEIHYGDDFGDACAGDRNTDDGDEVSSRVAEMIFICVYWRLMMSWMEPDQIQW
jgi:hypothetical protein